MTSFPQDNVLSSELDVVNSMLQELEPSQLVELWPQLRADYLQWPKTADAFEAAFRLTNALRLAGNIQDAQALAEFTLAAAYELKDEGRITKIQSVLGALHLNRGEVREARKSFLDALVAAQRVQDVAAVCRSRLWIAYVEQLSGYLQVAAQHAEECLVLARHHRLDSWRTAAIRSLAQSSYLSGRLMVARALLTEAVNLPHPDLEKLENSRLRLELSFVSTLLGDFQLAAALIPDARQQITLVCSRRDLAVSYEYGAALSLNCGDLPAAESAIREAVRISLEEFPDGDMTSQSYRIWAEIDVRKGDFEKAREHATDALGVARRVGERIEIGALERIFGQCDDETAEFESAQTHFGESIKILSDCGARYELAHSYLAAGKANAFDRATRLAHLHSALALFREMEVERLASEAEEAIRRLTSPPRNRIETVDAKITVITRDQAMKQVLADLDRFKDTPHVILLEGETGVGKDLLAAYAHFTSARADRPFVEFNAAAVPEALVESELFGHVRGSFTGAMRDREGLLFAAKHGTFFFNEIGEAPLSFQAKLLTVIESRKARPVGANVERTIEARLIFATNRDLRSEVSNGRFRKDLFFRLSTAHLKVPPLRDRIEDVGPLLTAFLQREGLAPEQINALRNTSDWGSLAAWPWEGNVRELSTFAQRLAVEVLADARQRPELVLPRLMKRTAGDNAESRESFERCRIESALKKSGGNKRRAASELGIPESTLRWKINHLGIELP